MQVATGVAMLEISAVIMGQVQTIHPTLLFDAGSALLVDAGYPGQLDLLRQAVAEAGVPFDRLGQVIVTHHDIDHIGGLPALIEETHGKIAVLAGEVEKPYIEGTRRPVKLTPDAIARAVASLPPEVPEDMRRRFHAALENPPRAGVDRVLGDGEALSDFGGLAAIITPGHTPGHLCLYHRPSKTLIAGDALSVKEGELFGPNPAATPDLAQATASLHKLAAYDIVAVICYHGGLYRGPANARIAELAQTAVGSA